MIVELINTGSELILGRTLNTHQQWLSRQLADLGYIVTRHVTVADTATDIRQAVREALARADLVITTGGLGPTSDDLTRELIAQLLDRPLREDSALVEHIRSFFIRRNRPLPEAARVQALVPDGATVLTNEYGTAPGLAMRVMPNPFRAEGAGSWIVMLPGPPRELHPMFKNAVVPLLLRELPADSAFVCRTLRTTGLAESLVEQRLAGPLNSFVRAGLDLGYCARVGQVDVRLAARGANALRLVNDASAIARHELEQWLFAEDDDELESVVVKQLTARKQTVAVAESCTGGCLANRITNVPGASAVFLAGFITYSNEAKQQFLGVRAETLAQNGAVSPEVAREMAEGARRRTNADFALSVTGIAGPAGGTPEKPVGTVFIGLAGRDGSAVEKQFNPYERETFKQLTTQQALAQLWRLLLKKP